MRKRDLWETTLSKLGLPNYTKKSNKENNNTKCKDPDCLTNKCSYLAQEQEHEQKHPMVDGKSQVCTFTLSINKKNIKNEGSQWDNELMWVTLRGSTTVVWAHTPAVKFHGEP